MKTHRICAPGRGPGIALLIASLAWVAACSDAEPTATDKNGADVEDPDGLGVLFDTGEEPDESTAADVPDTAKGSDVTVTDVAKEIVGGIGDFGDKCSENS